METCHSRTVLSIDADSRNCGKAKSARVRHKGGRSTAAGARLRPPAGEAAQAHVARPAWWKACVASTRPAMEPCACAKPVNTAPQTSHMRLGPAQVRHILLASHNNASAYALGAENYRLETTKHTRTHLRLGPAKVQHVLLVAPVHPAREAKLPVKPQILVRVRQR